MSGRAATEVTSAFVAVLINVVFGVTAVWTVLTSSATSYPEGIPVMPTSLVEIVLFLQYPPHVRLQGNMLTTVDDAVFMIDSNGLPRWSTDDGGSSSVELW